MHAEFAKREHRPPIVERRFLQPRRAIKDRRNVIVAIEHLARHLRISGFVRPYQPDAVAAENGNQSVEEEEDSKKEESQYFQRRSQNREARHRSRGAYA